MKKILLIVAPFAIVAFATLGAIALVKARPEVERQTPSTPPPLVRVMGAEFRDVPVTVGSQGTVEPRTATVLISEVSGRVVEVPAAFADGGFFEKGDVLLRIDSADYEFAVVQARSLVAQAELRLAQEEAEAAVARDEWRDLQDGDAPPLASRELQVAQARASLDAARAQLRQAERNVERTRVRAPYEGRIRRTQVDLGQYLAPGTPIASIFATDYVEVRLPVRDAELAFLDLPIGGPAPDRRVPVTLTGDFAGTRHRWFGEIVRVEGEIDPQTRMIHLVTRVGDPYRTADGPPLSVGLFVQAEIEGIPLDDVCQIPRGALRPDGTVLVVDEEDRLGSREVDVVRVDRERAYIRDGVEPGARICLSNLAVFTEGMKVRATETDPFGSTMEKTTGDAGSLPSPNPPSPSGAPAPTGEEAGS